MKQSIPIFTTTFALCGVIATAFAAGTPVSGLIPCMFIDQKTQCAAAVPGSPSLVTHMGHEDHVTINIHEGRMPNCLSTKVGTGVFTHAGYESVDNYTCVQKVVRVTDCQDLPAPTKLNLPPQTSDVAHTVRCKNSLCTKN